MAFDTYFHERAKRFASLYRSESVARAIGRGPIFDRLHFAVDTAVHHGAVHVVDVGCGSGPLFEPLASRGIRVTGLEPAAAMLDLARAQAARFPELVDVEERSWESIDEQDHFDLAAALGVFDYVDEPADLLTRLGRAAPRVVASFPAPGMRTNLRKIRYGARGVAVHPYTTQRILDLADESGLVAAEVRPLGRAGHVVAFERRQ